MNSLVQVNTSIVESCGVVPAYIYGLLNQIVFARESCSSPDLIKDERSFYNINVKKVCQQNFISYSQFKRSINVLNEVGFIEFLTIPVLGKGTRFLFHILPIAN